MSGKGRSDFVSRRMFSTRMLSSPLSVRNTFPVVPMMSPRSQLLISALSSSGNSFMFRYNCICPVMSWITRKGPRWRMMRPATQASTAISARPSLSLSPYAAWISAAKSAGRKSFGKALRFCRMASSFTRRCAISRFSSAASAPVAVLCSLSVITSSDSTLVSGYRPIFRLASMKRSRPPSSTAWVLLVSTFVRRSLIRESSRT